MIQIRMYFWKPSQKFTLVDSYSSTLGLITLYNALEAEGIEQRKDLITVPVWKL